MKIKKSFARRFSTFLTVVLTLSMLLLAAAYIGGTQFAVDGSAIKLEKSPEGSVSVGGEYEESTPVYEKGLLPVSFAGIRYGGKGGGAGGSEAAAEALLDFAKEHIHTCLESGARFTEVNKDAYLSATYGDFLLLDLISPLPYQMIYALTGEYLAPAGNEDAIDVDRAVLSFSSKSVATLCFSDGERFFISDRESGVHHSELSALAGDSRLSSFTVNERGVPVSSTAAMLPQLSFSADASISQDEKEGIYSIFGYTYSKESADDSAVSPHGTLKITPTRLVFSASRDGGIPVSDFLANEKNTLDVGIYDILLGSVTLCESLLENASGILDGAGLYLDGFYREDDTYTVIFGAAADNVKIYGSAYPYFAKITVQSGRFKSIEARFLKCERDSFTYPIFSSAWQYSHASENAEIYSLRPIYRVQTLPLKDVSAAWFYTGEKTGGDPS